MNDQTTTLGLQQALTLLEYDHAHLCRPASLPFNEQKQKAVKSEIAGGEPLRLPSETAYQALERLTERVFCLESSSSYLSWLMQVKDYMQPPLDEQVVNTKAIEDGLSAIALTKHRLYTQPGVKELLDEAAQDTTLSATQHRNLQLLHRNWLYTASLTPEESEQWERLKIRGHETWVTARDNNDFEHFHPTLEKLFEQASIRGKKFAKALGLATPYEGLLGEFNADLPLKTVQEAFATMPAQAKALIDQVQAVQQANPPLDLPCEIPVEVQHRVATKVAADIGYDFTRGRIDLSAHPQCTGNSCHDARITTVYDPAKPLDGLMSVVHEVGHALYALGLPDAMPGQPIQSAGSMWVHETQSYFWERMVAQTPEFYEYLQPLLMKEMADAGITINPNDPAWSAFNLYKIATQATPGLIRTEAEGLTAPLHVVVRDIEREVVEGTLTVENIPAEWDKRMKDILGVDVPNNAQGCLQDVHWSEGLMGYFPAYLFGTVGAAQIKAAMKRDIPDFADRVKHGDFKPLLGWLREHVHQLGCSLPNDKLIEHATGKPLSIDDWVAEIRSNLIAPYQGRWVGKVGGAVNAPNGDRGLV